MLPNATDEVEHLIVEIILSSTKKIIGAAGVSRD